VDSTPSSSFSPALSVVIPSASANPSDSALLQATSRLAATADTPRAAMEEILRLAIEHFGASSGTIGLLSPDTGKLEIEVHQGMPSDIDEVVLRPGQGITGWVAFHGRPQLVPDVRADPRYIPVRQAVRAEITAPLVSASGQVMGVINLDSDTVRGFTPAHLAGLVTLAEESTAVLLRLWQLQHLRGKARQLENLVNAGLTLVTKLERQELHDAITRDTRSLLNAHASVLYEYVSARRCLRAVSLHGAPGAVLPEDDLPLDSCLLASSLVTRRHVEFLNVQSPEFIDVVDLPRHPSLRSILAVPLLWENEPVGILAVFTDHPHRFNNDEKRLLAAFGSLSTVTLQNSRLYTRVFQSEETLRKNEQLTTLGLLAAEIAHEIRNPLTVIKLLYGYLGLDFPADDPRRTDVRVIGEKLDQLEAIVSRVLQFAKAPSSLHSRWSLADIVSDTLVLIRLKLAQGKIQLRFDPPTRPLHVDVHKGQLQQVLLNLLINATQAMPDGGTIKVAITTEGHDGARQAVIDVIDTGTGIPPELTDHIFDSFLSGRADGTGLGLAIAKRILLSHHGDITLQSTGPAGTTMRVRLPLAPN
jgi:signal transduction histidine kinase